MKTSPLIFAAFLLVSSINLFGFEPESIYRAAKSEKDASGTNLIYSENSELYDLTVINLDLDYKNEEVKHMSEFLTDEVSESIIEEWMIESDLLNDEFNELEPWMVNSDLIIEYNAEVEVENWMLDDDLLETESEDNNLEIVEAWMLDFETDNK